MRYVVAYTDFMGEPHARIFSDKERACEVAENAYNLNGGHVTVTDENMQTVCEFED